MPAQDGKRLMHSEIQVNGARIFVMDDFPEHRGSHGVDAVFPPDQIKGTSVTMHLEVENCDAAVKRAKGRRRHRHAGAVGFVLGRALCPHHGPVRPFLELCARAAGEGGEVVATINVVQPCRMRLPGPAIRRQTPYTTGRVGIESHAQG